MIRHATTDFNVAFQNVVTAYGFESEEYRKLKADLNLVDPPINELGMQ